MDPLEEAPDSVCDACGAGIEDLDTAGRNQEGEIFCAACLTEAEAVPA